MANLMVLRRTLLLEFLKLRLPDRFKFAHRLRLETFKSDNRADRVRIMGDPTAYCEVLYGGLSDNDQEDSGGRTVLDVDPFRVNLWLHYQDSDFDEHASQTEFDEIMFGENGIITGLREVDSLNPSGYSPGIPLDVTDINATVVSLDESGIELAHFLTFSVTVR